MLHCIIIIIIMNCGGDEKAEKPSFSVWSTVLFLTVMPDQIGYITNTPRTYSHPLLTQQKYGQSLLYIALHVNYKQHTHSCALR